MTHEELVEEASRVVREETIRQYREDDKDNCPAGSLYYEEYIGPELIARAVLALIAEQLKEPTDAMVKAREKIVLTFDDNGAAIDWEAMLAASPLVPPK